MDIVRIKAAHWPQWRRRLFAFARRHGDRRLTSGGLQAMLHAADEASDAATAPFAAVIAHEQGKLAGFAFALHAGRQACIVAVHPDARGQGVGLKLVTALIAACGGLCCCVAADNEASMRLFFRAGLKAVGIETGPTGKPTLLFQTDNYPPPALARQYALPAKEATSWRSPSLGS